MLTGDPPRESRPDEALPKPSTIMLATLPRRHRVRIRPQTAHGFSNSLRFNRHGFGALANCSESCCPRVPNWNVAQSLLHGSKPQAAWSWRRSQCRRINNQGHRHEHRSRPRGAHRNRRTVRAGREGAGRGRQGDGPVAAAGALAERKPRRIVTGAPTEGAGGCKAGHLLQLAPCPSIYLGYAFLRAGGLVG